MQHGKLGSSKRHRSLRCPSSPTPPDRVCSRCGSMGECTACAARPSCKAPRTSHRRWHRARVKYTLRRLFLPHVHGRPLVDGLPVPPRLGCLSQALRLSAQAPFPPSSSSEIARMYGEGHVGSGRFPSNFVFLYSTLSLLASIFNLLAVLPRVKRAISYPLRCTVVC